MLRMQTLFVRYICWTSALTQVHQSAGKCNVNHYQSEKLVRTAHSCVNKFLCLDEQPVSQLVGISFDCGLVKEVGQIRFTADRLYEKPFVTRVDMDKETSEPVAKVPKLSPDMQDDKYAYLRIEQEPRPHVYTQMPQQPREKKPGQLNKQQLDNFFEKVILGLLQCFLIPYC